MSALTDLQASLNTLSGDVTAYVANVTAEFATLKAQIAALGTGATDADLAALNTQVGVVDAAIKGAPVVPVP